MKTLVLLSLVALAIASDFKMKLNENGEKFNEEIKVDVAANTEEIRVPQHQDRVQVAILNDFNIGLQALKIVKAKHCYISAIDASEQRPAKMEESMKLAQSQFPEDHYMVDIERLLQIRKMSADEVGQKIADHCKGNELIFAVKVTKKNMEETALNAVKAMKSRPKRSTVRKFNACKFDEKTAMVIETCPRDRLGAQCQFRRTDGRSCSYRVTCRPQNGVASCTGVHKFSFMYCCDFMCM